MPAELAQAAGRRDEAAALAAPAAPAAQGRQAWQNTMGQPWRGRLVVLH